MMDKRNYNNLDGEMWTKDDDLQLVEAVLRNVKLGNSVIDGCREFEEATKGKRSVDASKFRFHTKLKAQYLAAYEIARKEGKKAKASKRRKINKGERMEQIMTDILDNNERPLVIDDVLTVLNMYKKQVEEKNLDGKYEEEVFKLRREKERLVKENRKLKEEMKELKAEFKEMSQDYRELKNALKVFQNVGILQNNAEKAEYKINKDGTIEKM